MPTGPHPRARRAFVALLFTLAAGAPRAEAHIVSGTVVSPGGAPLANIDIDAFNAVTGVEVTLSGDFSGPTGQFAFDLPTGVYDLVFRAPLPPASTFLDARVANVAVAAPVQVGTVALGAGVSFSGRVVDSAGVPRAGVDLDYFNGATGEVLTTGASVTDALGRFLVSVPPGALILEVEPPLSSLPRLAPRRLQYTLVGNTDIGDIALQPGFLVTATVQRTGGLPVASVDLDVEDAATGVKLHTPGDDTNALGFVDIVLPAGNFRVQYCPPLAANLVSQVAPNVAVGADLSLGIVTLVNGVRLSGRVTAAFGGAPVPRVDVDVRAPGTLNEVPLCDDDTDSLGNYVVVVPTGTWDIAFTPRYADPFASAFFGSRVVPGATVVNASLAGCGTLQSARAGQAGTGGIVPTLTAAGGCLRIPNPDLTVTIRQGRGGARAYLISGVLRANGLANLPAGAPPRPRLSAGAVRVLGLSGTPGAAGQGTATVALPLAYDPVFVGMDLFVAAWIQDPAAVGGWSWTDVRTGALCQ